MANSSAAAKRYTTKTLVRYRRGTDKNGRTHRLLFPQHPQNKYRFEKEESSETDQWEQLVKDVEGNVAVVWAGQATYEGIRVTEGGVERDVSSANEEGYGGE